MIPAEQVTAFEQEMDQAGVDYFVVSYPGVKHSFTNPTAGDYGIEALVYDPQADRQSWQMLLWLLEDTFK